MSEAKERRLKRMEEERIAKRKTYFEQLRIYLAKQERRNLEAYNSRRITYLDGGFEDYEEIIKMTPQKVLLKQVHESVKEGIAIPDQYKDKMSKYQVICFG
jgi:Na+/phosphate symporter